MQISKLPSVAAVLTLALALAHPVDAFSVYVRQHAGPVFDGGSWATAFGSVQAGIDAASAGDEVWVAAGSYRERIVLKSNVAVYGGFAGTETARGQRDWRTNVCLLDGDYSGPVVEMPADAAVSTRIDGFTITNGRAPLGGGVLCGQRSLGIVSNNCISGNAAACDGGAVYCMLESAPTIINNTIRNNTASRWGGAICSTSGNTLIAGNLLMCNSATEGGAICCGYPGTNTGESISNNTIFANSAVRGGGIYAGGDSAARIANNIIAFNSSGIRKDAGTRLATLTTNCLYANTEGDYSGLSAGSSDVLNDPQLASSKFGNLHIQPSSPCRDHGTNSSVAISVDMDGEARVQAVVDIGADESDGTSWIYSGRIIRVTPTGSDTNDGGGWDDARAKRTVQAAIDALRDAGGEVWLKNGSFAGAITLNDFVYLRGGFLGTETSVSERPPDMAPSKILAEGRGPAVTARMLGHRVSCIDGLHLMYGSAYNGGAIFCDSASPIISANRIESCTARSKGGGIYLLNSSALVERNTLSLSTSLTGGGGIFCDKGCPEINSNIIRNNSSAVSGCGIGISADSAAKVVNNAVLHNSEVAGFGGSWGGGVEQANYNSPVLAHNTIARNSASLTGGVYVQPFGSLNLVNSIVAFNSSGVKIETGASSASSRKSCVHGNTGFNYSGYAGASGDITLNPLFVDSQSDFHLQMGSPCVDAADASAAPGADLDLIPRPLDGDGNLVSLPDMGSYELSRGFTSAADARGLADGQPLAVTGLVSTATLPGLFYIERPDRQAGIGVQGVSSGAGRLTTVEGTMTTSGGERLIAAYNVIQSAAAQIPDPFAVGLRALGGGPFGLQQGVAAFHGQDKQAVQATGPSNIGLLVSVWGTVTSHTAAGFYLDDGSELYEAVSSPPGVLVAIPAGATAPAVGSFVTVTGVSACYQPDQHVLRLVRVWRPEDVVIH